MDTRDPKEMNLDKLDLESSDFLKDILHKKENDVITGLDVRHLYVEIITKVGNTWIEDRKDILEMYHKILKEEKNFQKLDKKISLIPKTRGEGLRTIGVITGSGTLSIFFGYTLLGIGPLADFVMALIK